MNEMLDVFVKYLLATVIVMEDPPLGAKGNSTDCNWTVGPHGEVSLIINGDGTCVVYIPKAIGIYVENVHLNAIFKGCADIEVGYVVDGRRTVFKPKIGTPFRVDHDHETAVSFRGIANVTMWFGNVVEVTANQRSINSSDLKMEIDQNGEKVQIPSIFLGPGLDFMWFHVSRNTSKCRPDEQSTKAFKIEARGQKFKSEFYGFDSYVSMWRNDHIWANGAYRHWNYPMEQMMLADKCWDIRYDLYDASDAPLPEKGVVFIDSGSGATRRQWQLDPLESKEFLSPQVSVFVELRSKETEKDIIYNSMNAQSPRDFKCQETDAIVFLTEDVVIFDYKTIKMAGGQIEITAEKIHKRTGEGRTKIKQVGSCVVLRIQPKDEKTYMKHHCDVDPNSNQCGFKRVDAALQKLKKWVDLWGKHDFDNLNTGTKYYEKVKEKINSHKRMHSFRVCMATEFFIVLALYILLALYADLKSHGFRMWCFCNCRLLYEKILTRFDPIDYDPAEEARKKKNLQIIQAMEANSNVSVTRIQKTT